MSGAVEQAIIGYLRQHFLPHTEGARLGPEDDLIETGTIDSVALVTLVGWVEERYSFHVADEDLLPENFRSVRAIAAFVCTRVPGLSSATGPTAPLPPLGPTPP